MRTWDTTPEGFGISPCLTTTMADSLLSVDRDITSRCGLEVKYDIGSYVRMIMQQLQITYNEHRYVEFTKSSIFSNYNYNLGTGSPPRSKSASSNFAKPYDVGKVTKLYDSPP